MTVSGATSIRWTAVVGLVCVALVAAVLVGGSDDDGHAVTIVADDARFLQPGMEVRSAGRTVGEITGAEATPAGRARLEVRIDDEDAWPLPVGTLARFRWARAIAFTNRYVDLELPRTAARGTIPEGGSVRAGNVMPSVEVDEVAALFDRPTRDALRRTLTAGGRALRS